jgi:type IV/VI secretion system ImpK/VasF family protein
VSAFLSYARANEAEALRLARALRERGARVWVDQDGIPSGAHWDTAVQDALIEAQALILLMSKAAVSSKHVLDELAFALDENKLVVPVLLEPCSRPLRVRRIQHIEFTTTAEVAERIGKALGIPDQEPPATRGAGSDLEQNPLILAAGEVFELADQIRTGRELATPGRRQRLKELLRDYASHAQRLGCKYEHGVAGRYVLCALLDEIIVFSGIGERIYGPHARLLVEFHNEVDGGEKVFQLLPLLAKDPDENVHLLQLIHASLAHGFRGRYRSIPGGDQELLGIRQNLAQLLGLQLD